MPEMKDSDLHKEVLRLLAKNEETYVFLPAILTSRPDVDDPLTAGITSHT